MCEQINWTTWAQDKAMNIKHDTVLRLEFEPFGGESEFGTKCM